MSTVGILLAAGKSRRFGDGNKLTALYMGRPLISHAANTMRSLKLDYLIAVVSGRDVAIKLDGFQHVWPNDSERSLSSSIKAGIRCAYNLGAQRALVALADMPCVTPRHFSLLLKRCSDETPSATTDGERRMVPACFPRRFFPLLLGLTGDVGAQSLLGNLPNDSVIRADIEELFDMDTPHDFISQTGVRKTV